MNNLKLKTWLVVILLCASLVVLVAAIITKGNHNSSQTPQGKVSLTYNNLADTKDITTSFNNKTVIPTDSSSNTYTLSPGSYIVIVTKPGYKQFSTNFTLRSGGSIIINVNLQIATQPKPIQSLSQVAMSSPTFSGATIINTMYYYNKTWAVVLVQAYGSNAVIVTQYDAASQTWKAVLGPGTTFNQSDVQNLPVQVSQYLSVNNYINPGE